MTLSRILRALLAGALVAAAVAITAPVARAAGASYYVDCRNGNDSLDGRAQSTAWNSISRINAAQLRPGDNVWLARGCQWNGTQLSAWWNGTQSAPITIGAYGSGDRPTIKNGGPSNVKVTGSFLVLENLNLTFDPIRKDPCGQPLGTYYGATFTDGAHDNILRRSISSKATAGVHLGTNSWQNKITGNQLVGNNVLETFNDSTPADDLGAWGMVVNGNGNEIAYNTFRDNAAVCAMPGQWLMSNSIEIYEGSNNWIHHNKSYGDRVFSELGGSSSTKATNNRYAYNLYSTARPDSRFIVTRGGGSAYGPVKNTVLNHNTSYQTGARSQGVICELGCSSNILTLSGSIIWAEEKAVYADAPFAMSNTLVWNSAGDPLVQISGSPGLTNVDFKNPMFNNPGGGSFLLRSGSAAIDADWGQALAAKDLKDTTVPQGARNDKGSFEFGG